MRRTPTVFFDPVGGAYGNFHAQPLGPDGGLPGPEALQNLPPAPPGSRIPGSDATTFQSGWVLEPLLADDAVTLYAAWGDLPWLVLAALLALAGLLSRAPKSSGGATMDASMPPPEGIR